MSLNKRNEVFKTNLRRLLASLKNSENISEAIIKGIDIPELDAKLIPISRFMENDEIIINELSNWRKENEFAYPAQFDITYEGTKKWLKNAVIDNDDRILFFIIDKLGNRIGHIGFANCNSDKSELEIDNVLRGSKTYDKGIMTLALKAIIDWAESILLVKRITLKVLSDNDHAIEFYKKNNFKEIDRLPLKKVVGENRIDWVDGCEKEADKYFIVMEYFHSDYEIPNETILTAGPSVSCLEKYYTYDATKNGWNNQWSKYIKQFEKEFADYLGVKYALTTSCCTGALHLSLLALGVGSGDEVIVPDLTWVASAQVINYVGATAIFADIDRETWTLDPKSFKSKITAKTKAVIPVHLYGHPAKMDEIMQIAAENNLYVVEDAAPSIGAEFNGQKTGTFGHFGCFSFQGAKLAVTGEGGMMVTNDDELYNKFYKIWDQGRVPGSFWIDTVGWKYKMSNLQAAFGLGQLQRVDTLVEAKRQIFEWYCEYLSDCNLVKLNKEKEWARSIYWMSSIYLEKNDKYSRDELISELKKYKIDTRPVFPAISRYPFWTKKQSPQEVANDIGDNSINLPSGVCLKKEEIQYVCNIIKKILG